MKGDEKLAKKINAELKRAYYYFGFEELVPYNVVSENIKKLKEASEDDSELLVKVESYEGTVEKFFNTPELKDDDTFSVPFAKDEPRKSWESYKDDFVDFDLDGEIDVSSDDVVEEDVPV